ncbi:hypothetical protein PR048_022560 [Dryococelus australis]|uniref:Uncharacterized protein n=1 Tax=Dryococelus australis TaxID=614101 RepID=A0ABQ9H1N4_9NEOP|nr:hypothetical protein PR048_022560 [Dryococelus australis]
MVQPHGIMFLFSAAEQSRLLQSGDGVGLRGKTLYATLVGAAADEEVAVVAPRDTPAVLYDPVLLPRCLIDAVSHHQHCMVHHLRHTHANWLTSQGERSFTPGLCSGRRPNYPDVRVSSAILHVALFINAWRPGFHACVCAARQDTHVIRVLHAGVYDASIVVYATLVMVLVAVVLVVDGDWSAHKGQHHTLLVAVTESLEDCVTLRATGERIQRGDEPAERRVAAREKSETASIATVKVWSGTGMKGQGGGWTGDPREKPPTINIVRHDSHMRKSVYSDNRPSSKQQITWLTDAARNTGWAGLQTTSCLCPPPKTLRQYGPSWANLPFTDLDTQLHMFMGMGIVVVVVISVVTSLKEGTRGKLRLTADVAIASCIVSFAGRLLARVHYSRARVAGRLHHAVVLRQTTRASLADRSRAEANITPALQLIPSDTCQPSAQYVHTARRNFSKTFYAFLHTRLRSAHIHWHLRQIRSESPISTNVRTPVLMVSVLELTVVLLVHTTPDTTLYFTSVHYWPVVNQWRAKLISTQSNYLSVATDEVRESSLAALSHLVARHHFRFREQRLLTVVGSDPHSSLHHAHRRVDEARAAYLRPAAIQAHLITLPTIRDLNISRINFGTRQNSKQNAFGATGNDFRRTPRRWRRTGIRELPTGMCDGGELDLVDRGRLKLLERVHSLDGRYVVHSADVPPVEVPGSLEAAAWSSSPAGAGLGRLGSHDLPQHTQQYTHAPLGPRWCGGQTAREPRSNPGGAAPGDRALRRRWSVSFLGGISFSKSSHSGAAPFPPCLTLVGSQDTYIPFLTTYKFPFLTTYKFPSVTAYKFPFLTTYKFPFLTTYKFPFLTTYKFPFLTTYKFPFLTTYKFPFLTTYKFPFLTTYKFPFLTTYKFPSVTAYKFPFLTTYKFPFLTTYKFPFLTTYKFPFLTTYKFPFLTTYKFPFLTTYKFPSVTAYKFPFLTTYKFPFLTTYKFPFLTRYKFPFLTTYKIPFLTTYKFPFLTTYKFPSVTAYKFPFLTTYKFPFLTTYKFPFLTTYKFSFLTTYKFPFLTTYKFPFLTTYKFPFLTTYKFPFLTTYKFPFLTTYKFPFLTTYKFPFLTKYKFPFLATYKFPFLATYKFPFLTTYKFPFLATYKFPFLTTYKFPFLTTYKFPFLTTYKFPFLTTYKFPFLTTYKFPFLTTYKFPFLTTYKFPFLTTYKFSFLTLQRTDQKLVRVCERRELRELPRSAGKAEQFLTRYADERFVYIRPPRRLCSIHLLHQPPVGMLRHSCRLQHSTRFQSAGPRRRGKRDIHEKTRRSEVSSGTIPTCEDPGASLPGIEPVSSSSLSTTPLRPPRTNSNHPSVGLLNSELPQNDLCLWRQPMDEHLLFKHPWKTKEACSLQFHLTTELQRRNARAGEIGDPRENPQTDDIVPRCGNLRATPSGVKPGSPRWEACSLTTEPPLPLQVDHFPTTSHKSPMGERADHSSRRNSPECSSNQCFITWTDNTADYPAGISHRCGDTYTIHAILAAGCGCADEPAAIVDDVTQKPPDLSFLASGDHLGLPFFSSKKREVPPALSFHLTASRSCIPIPIATLSTTRTLHASPEPCALNGDRGLDARGRVAFNAPSPLGFKRGKKARARFVVGPDAIETPAGGRRLKKGHERGVLWTAAADTRTDRRSLRQQGLRMQGVKMITHQLAGVDFRQRVYFGRVVGSEFGGAEAGPVSEGDVMSPPRLGAVAVADD